MNRLWICFKNIQWSVLWSVVSSGFYLSGLLLSSYGSWLPSVGQKREHLLYTFYFQCYLKIDIKTSPWLCCDIWKWQLCLMWITEEILGTRQLLDGRALELPLAQQVAILCLCSPVTGCVSAGVWSTALEQTEVLGTLHHRTCTWGSRFCPPVWPVVLAEALAA